ncbi:MAG: DUF2839 family protein [Cyanobacteria bacterium M_surface_7_m2_040]|nr:DUF2839 family protein [Cyanobacteria bacterium K_Offshore_0m_m2_072]MBM5826464.1 DUF2839 family protein [Cyanobacteria bacterium M_surface_7_m2_040]
MGEAKRRSAQGLPPRQVKANTSTKAGSGAPTPWWNPAGGNTGERFVALTTRGAWIGIGALVVFWITVRFIGPALGWWTLADG